MTQWLGQVVMLTTASGIVPALTTGHYVGGEQTDIGADSADSVDILTLGSSSTQFTNIPRINAPTFTERLSIAPGFYFVGEAGDTGGSGDLPSTHPFIFTNNEEGGAASFSIVESGNAGINLEVTSARAHIDIYGESGQTDSLLQLYDGDNKNIFVITPFDNLTYGPEKSAFTFTQASPGFGTGGDLFIAKIGVSLWPINIFGYEHWTGGSSAMGGAIALNAGGGGAFYAQAGPDSTSVYITATHGQTYSNSILGVLNENGTNIFEVTQDSGAVGKIGFFGANAVVQQTGVAISDAAIHAALVNLGLITA